MILESIVRKKTLIPIGFSLLALLVYGYQFNNGDQEEFLPYVYRILNPGLYPGDTLVDFQLQHFNIRFFFAYLLAGGGAVFGVDGWTFILQFTCLFFISRSLTEMASRRSPWNISLYLPSFFLLVFYSLPVGGNTLFDIQLTPTMPALAVGCYALERFDLRRYQPAMILCGIASCFQLLIGLHLMLLMLIIVVADRNALSLKLKLKLPFLYLLTASPMLVPMVYRQFLMPVVYQKDVYFDILFLFRNAHHYSPFHFPVTSYLKAVGFIAVMVFVFLRQTIEKNGKAPQLMAWVILGCIVYTIGFEEFKMETIAKTQWFKSTIWMVLYSIPVLSAFSSDSIRINIQPGYGKLLFLYVVVIFLLFNSSVLPLEKTAHRYKLGNYKKGDLQLLHEWINKHLPDSAIVLSFPSDDALRCETLRSTPVTFKAIVHEPEYMIGWYRLINTYYRLDRFHANTLNDKITLGDQLYHQKTVPGLLKTPGGINCLLINNMYYPEDRITQNRVLAKFGQYSAIELNSTPDLR
jgi:hypothetical protein